MIRIQKRFIPLDVTEQPTERRLSVEYLLVSQILAPVIQQIKGDERRLATME
jgi:hypothetical protein